MEGRARNREGAWSLKTQRGGKGSGKWPPGQGTVKLMLETMGTKSHAVMEAGSLNLASVSISASFVLWIQTHHFRLIPIFHRLPDHFL